MYRDKRTFNIADAGAGAAADAGTGAAAAEAVVAGAEGTGAAADPGGESAPAAPVFTDWTGEVLTPLIPEGFELEEAQSAKMLEIVNTAKGDPAKVVSGMLSYYTEVAQQTAEALAADYTKTQADWQAEMKADADFGGTKLDASLAVAKETASRYGGPELLELFRVTGAGNSVHMLRFLNKVAAALPREATPAGGRAAAQPKTLGDRLFAGKQ